MRSSGRDQFRKYRWIIIGAARLVSVFPWRFSNWLLQVLRNTSGALGIVLRYILIRNLAKSCGDNVAIMPGVYLLNLRSIEFGSNVSIHPMCYLDGAGGIVISDNVSIAHSSSLLSTDHTWDLLDIPIKYNPCKPSPTVICDDVWIGCGCRIVAGVTVGSRAVIAAGAVLVNSVRGQAVYGGVPAREIKKLPSEPIDESGAVSA